MKLPLHFKSDFKSDLLASLVVFLVALPLCMGIAIASGAPPAAGLITGIIGGIVAGSLSGCPLQVSGPAAGLAVIVFELIRAHGIAMLGPLLLVAGTLQLVAGAFKAGQWFRAISPAVIYGMLAGIGILIFASQFHVMLDANPQGGGLANLTAIPAAIQRLFSGEPNSSQALQAACIGAVTIAVLVGWNQWAPQKLRWMPGALLAVLVATGIASWGAWPVNHVELPQSLLNCVRLPSLDALANLADLKLLTTAATLAFVASAETLLSAAAVDKMHQGPPTHYDRELCSQGVGNMLCGLVGGLPMTGVIVRSATNVNAGAKTRRSAILHGLWLLAMVAAFPWALKMIPTSCLAAILVYTGVKLVEPQYIRQLLSYGGMPFVIYGATVATIVAKDLLSGILVGLALSIAKLVWVVTHLNIKVKKNPHGTRFDLRLEGVATFLRLPKLLDALNSLPQGVEIHVHFNELDYIDHACMEALFSWHKQRASKDSTIVFEWKELMNLYTSKNRFRPPHEPKPSMPSLE